jgi:hypothetical protein
MDLRDWYEEQWAQAADFKPDLIALLDESKFGEREYTPYEVYMKALYEYFLDEMGGDALDPGRSAVALAEFQDDAVRKARRILTRYDGVLIADSVGLGKTWSAPKPIPSLGRHVLADGVEEGYCDVVPEYHPQSGTVLAIGHNVYYEDGVLTRPDTRRHPVYAVRRNGAWGETRVLAWEDPRGSAMYTCGCAQRVTLENGDIVIPVSFVPRGREDRGVGAVICAYDGEVVRIIASGNELCLPIERGLLEPSIVRFGGKFYMTIRAEDGCGYASVSDDGLHWEKQTPWRWDDGEPLTMSTTQQRWLPHSDALFLVYTRKAENNVNVMR